MSFTLSFPFFSGFISNPIKLTTISSSNKRQPHTQNSSHQERVSRAASKKHRSAVSIGGHQAQSGAAIGMPEVEIASDTESDDPGALVNDSLSIRKPIIFEVVRNRKRRRILSRDSNSVTVSNCENKGKVLCSVDNKKLNPV